MTRRRVALILGVLAAAVFSTNALAYLKLGTRQGDRVISLSFTTLPVRYFITNRDVPGVAASQLRDAVGRAFSSWAGAANVRLSSEFVGFTGADPISGDGANVIGFTTRADLDRVLGSTSITVDTVTGAIAEADIFFNSLFTWSATTAGEPGRQDIESIALHEVGHMLGLGHSMIGETELVGTGRRVIGAEAVMFPIAFSAGVVNRSLKADDIAGIADIYGTGTFRSSTGSIAGRVTKNGSGVLGAHVLAFSPASGKLIAGFSLAQDGAFVIGGLEPGAYVVRVEPLDDGDPTSFIEPSLTVDADFRPAFYDRLVTVPRAGTSRNIEIKVVPK